MTTAKRFKPEAIVKVYTEKGELVARSKAAKEGDAIDAAVQVVTTNNDLGMDAGTFTVTLTAQNRWDLSIASNDLVVILMRRDAKETDKQATVFYGLVDTVDYLITIENGQVQRQVSITGRSFAKVLINFEIGVVSAIAGVDFAFPWLEALQITFTKKSVKDIIDQIFKQYIKKYTNYTFSNGKTLLDMLKLDLDKSRQGTIQSPMSEITFASYQGTLYNFFKELIDEPFGQMYFEVKDGDPYFILRETPFNEKQWKALQLWQVTDEELVGIQVSRNDIETYTLFSVGDASMTGTLDGTLGAKPLVYEPYLKKYGIRRLHRYSNYVEQSLDKIQQYTKDLFNWNVMNPSYYSGTVVVRGDNRYKVGDRLLVSYTDVDTDKNGKRIPNKRELEFFIEGVQHEFVNFSHWKTRLSVTRGLPQAGKDRFNLPQPKEYQGGGVGDPAVGQTNSSSSPYKQLAYEADQLLLTQLGFGSVVGNGSSGGISGASGVSGSAGTQQVAQYYLGSTFKQQNNFGEWRGDHRHNGEDMSAPTGTPIYALLDGVVTQNSYQAGGAGYYVDIKSGNVTVKYFHMNQKSPVPKGTQVKAGDLIGYVGQTGRATGPHLHMEIWVGGQVQNPVPILKQLANGSTPSGFPASSSSSSNFWNGTGGMWM